MWLVFLLFVFLIGIIFSCIEVNLYSVEISEKNANFKLIVSLKIFYVFKILFIRFDRFGIKFLNKRVLYKELMSKREIKNMNKNILKMLENLNVKIKKANFTLKIGLLDMSLTNISIVLFSSIFPFLIKKRINKKYLYYKVLPDYNHLLVSFKGEMSISIRVLTLIKYYFKNIKLKMMHNKSKNYEVKESF